MKEKQKEKRIRRPRKNCNPTICCHDTLMSGDEIFVDWDGFRLNCLPECDMKNTCAYILTLLDQNKIKQALETLKNSKEGKK